MEQARVTVEQRVRDCVQRRFRHAGAAGVSSIPQLAMVVITEEQARAKEIDIETGRPPFTQKHSGEMNGLAALLVTAAFSGRAYLANLTHRSVRWRVPVRWYLVALFSVPVGATLISLVIYGPQALAMPSGGWPRALAEVVAVFVVQLVLFQLAEEIGFTGFLQHHWQDRYHPMKLTLYVALLWAVWHVPDHFAEEGWGVEALISAPVVFAVEVVSLFFARALFVWFYNRTGSSVLLVAIFHASFDAAISQLSRDVVPGSNTAGFLIFTGVIVVFATAVIIATKGQLGRAKAALETQAGVSDADR
jgi:uncharacterized protein